MEKILKIHEFAPRWHILNVPERFVVCHCTMQFHYTAQGPPARRENAKSATVNQLLKKYQSTTITPVFRTIIQAQEKPSSVRPVVDRGRS